MVMKWLALPLFLLLLLLQYRLWFAEGSLAELDRLQTEISRQQGVNDTLRNRNQRLEHEVLELQSGLDSLEERAREELGMVKEGETYYQVLEATEEDAKE
jgi:cell division protein FtsB